MKALRETIHMPSGHSFRILGWNKNLRNAECLLASGDREPFAGEGGTWHYHLEMELTFFSYGEGSQFIGDHIGRFRKDDVVLLGENLPHYWHTAGESSGLSIQWHFPESHAFWAFPENLVFAKLFKAAGRGLRFHGFAAEALRAEVRNLASSQERDRLGRLMQVLSRMQGALGRDTEYLSERSFSLPTASLYQESIRMAVRYLVANFRDTVELSDLLKLTGMSKATFARQFKEHTGRSFREFLNRFRLEAACRELATSNRDVIEIAYLCGFSEMASFNRVFRRDIGHAPTEYRKLEQAKQKAANSKPIKGTRTVISYGW